MIEQIRVTRFDFKPVCDECGVSLLTGPQPSGAWAFFEQAVEGARSQGWWVDDNTFHSTCGRCRTTAAYTKEDS